MKAMRAAVLSLAAAAASIPVSFAIMESLPLPSASHVVSGAQCLASGSQVIQNPNKLLFISCGGFLD